MRTIIIGEETIELNGVPRVLSYALLVGELINEFGKMVGESYGVEIRFTNQSAQPGQVNWEMVSHKVGRVIDLTTRQNEVLAFISLLRRCKVTPVTLKDVAIDALPLSGLVTDTAASQQVS